MICRGLCACTEMLWMCVLYVSFGSKVRPRTFGCVAMGSALMFIVRSRLLVWLCVFLGCTRTCVCGCDCDVVCIGHDLNRFTWWW